ncbi:MAG TPA: hypothetical protein VEU30_11600, partial [Thermoanaerobaculia bacterium]|nr:hypothetical protein [Thermoanaerobaculia bacterium]
CTGSTEGYATVTVNGGCAPANTTITTAPTNYSSATQFARVSASSGSTYSWSVINGTLLTPQGQSQIQYALGCSGTTTVNVTIKRSCGTTSSGTASVAIVRSNAVVSGSQAIYYGQAATIQATYTGTYPWSIIWSDGEAQYNIYSETVYREVTPTTTTTYTATEVRDKSWCSGTVSGSATVNVQ